LLLARSRLLIGALGALVFPLVKMIGGLSDLQYVMTTLGATCLGIEGDSMSIIHAQLYVGAQ